MKYFIDTEFIEGFHKPMFGKRRHFIDLISIGIVREDGRTYSAISNEYQYKDAYKWVLKNTSCGCAFKELRSLAENGEYPDVIGFGSGGHSVLVEVKVSRNDFAGEQKRKHFRVAPELGMGTQRFYFAPEGVIKIEDLPTGWGLVVVGKKCKPRVAYSPYKGNIGERHEGFHNKNIRAEHGLMYSALRRLHKRGLIEEIYKPFK